MNYDNPIPLAGDVLKQRIFSPLAYAAVRNANILPIAAMEAGRFAAHFPIAWLKSEAGYKLVIVRSLLTDGRGHAPGTQRTLPFLPVMARAYPFLYDPTHGPVAGQKKFVDSAIADEPNDLGAPICYVDGRPTKATTQRITLLDAAAASFGDAAAITASLEKADLFEPWPLHFEDVAGHTLDVDGLWIVKQDAVDTGVFASVMRAHGIAAADLIGLHRLSLFRAGMLLAQARIALQAPASAESKAPPAAAIPEDHAADDMERSDP